MKKEYREEDDERVIADMTGIERRNPFVGRIPSKRRGELAAPEETEQKPYQEDLLNDEQRKWYILGTLKAALMIGAVYAVVFGIVILLMVLIWNH